MKLDFFVNFFPFVDYKLLAESDNFTEVMHRGDLVAFERFEIFAILQFNFMLNDRVYESKIFLLLNKGALMDEFMRGVNFGEDFVFLVEEK